MTPPSFLDLIEDYLAFRRGLGFKLRSQSVMLRDFGRYADRIGHKGHLTTDLAVEWALLTRSRDPAHAALRLSTVRMFAQHRALFDSATEVPPVGLLGRISRRRKPPHIYSDAEISALLREANLLQPRHGLRPKTYSTFFSLLLSTGLRLSEACCLTHDDVDLANGILLVRRSKFRKSRLVPLHPTTTAALTRYATYRDEFGIRSESFFRTDRAPALTPSGVYCTFRTLRDSLGWSAQGRVRRPRQHDLRHTFAVRRLLAWYEEGADVDRKMLALATYLGHVKPAETYWYLSAVPELMAIVSQHFETFAQSAWEARS